jgi:DNA-binding MarR family transcriptional regulator
MATAHRTSLARSELNAWRGMLATHSAIIARLDSELEREHGLPLSSYEVLLLLSDAPGHSLRMGELAERLFLSRSGLTRLVDRLARDGLVAREVCESDRRGYYARLTPRGLERFHDARPTHLGGVRRHFLAKLDAGDLEALARVWAKVGPPGATGDDG